MTKRSTYGAIALAFGAAITVTLSGCNVPVLSQTTKTYDEARAAHERRQRSAETLQKRVNALCGREIVI